MRKIVLFVVGFCTIVLYGAENSGQIFADKQTVWTALILMGAVSIAIIYFSSKQLKKTKQLHEDMTRRQLEMEQSQTELLTSMTENILDMTKEAIDNRDAILKSSKEHTLEQVLAQVTQAENILLDRTHDIIDFLRLKSKKVEIVNESFNINNVLNEVSGSVCANFQGSQAELIFDIHNDIPRMLVGDSLRLGQILINLLDYSLTHTPVGEIKLDISLFRTFEHKTELQFQIIDTGIGMDASGLENLFVPYYNEEGKEHVRLGLFVAQQLVEMMGGEITVQSIPEKGTTFTFVLPLEIEDPENRRRYRLPEKILTTKKVFVVDGNYNSALAIKKMFAYFKHDVRVVSKEQFATLKPNWEEYDIIVLDKTLFSQNVVAYLENLKRKKELKVIGVESLLRPIQSPRADAVIDRELVKPLNQERIFDLIVDLYRIDVDKVLAQEDASSEQGSEEKKKKVVLTYKKPIATTGNITRDNFSDFRGAKLLIVEDNLINQKVLTTILEKSGMEISIANNGEDALMLVTSGKTIFDFVLMDINMPVMDGYTSTEHIRATGKFDDLPIVAFTALVLDSEVEKMFNAGMNAFLAKPLNVGKLYTAFSLYIDVESSIEPSDMQSEKSKKIVKKLDGLTVHEGIRYANGDEALYMEVLREFIGFYGESSDVFARLVEEKRFEQIKMLCLDMKGLTMAIGAEEMHRKVDEIYKLFIYGNQTLLPKCAEGYRKELERLLESIDIYLDNHTNYSV